MRPSVIILLFSLLQPVLGETQGVSQKGAEKGGEKVADLFVSQGCAACHQINQPVDPNKVIVGPPLAAVGSRYANDPKGLETILTSLRQGGGGKWGKNEMPPQSHLTQEHALQLARWILTLRQEDKTTPALTPATPPATPSIRPVVHSPLISERRVGTVVEVLDTPVVYRTYLPGACSRAIAVGLPGGISYGFDATECRLLGFWSGGFLDMEKSWTGFGGWYASVLGETVYEAPAHFPLRIGSSDKLDKKTTVQFKGYRLVQGQPEFRYQLDGHAVTHRIDYQAKSADKAASITHHFSLPELAGSVFFLPAKDTLAYQSDDADLSSGIFVVHADKRHKFSISISLKPLNREALKP